MKVIRRTRKEVYALWVKALRSGEYKQGIGWLRNGNKFCCLGVLCDLARKDGGPEWVGQEFWDSSNILPPVMAWFMGLDSSTQRSLAMMNDRGESFARIAEHIETDLMKD